MSDAIIDSSLVKISIGPKTKVKVQPAKGKDNFPRLYVTIDLGKTTPEELQSQLSQLKIKYINLGDLEKIAGGNKVFDSHELAKLDDCLEKSMALSELSESGIKVDFWIIVSLTPEKAKDSAYIQLLKYLQKSGAEINSDVINCISLEKVKDPAYIQVLKDLQKSGIKVDGYVIYFLTPEKAKDSAYIQVLKDLRKSGIIVDGNSIYFLSPETAKDSAYIQVLKDLQKSGIEVDDGVIFFLTPEKAKNPAYIQALKYLQKSGIKVDGDLISYLTLEKAKNPAYIQTLKGLKKAGIKVYYWVVNCLTLEKAKDSAYIQALKGKKGDFIFADNEYIRRKTGKDVSQINNITELAELYRDNYNIDVSEQILFNKLRQEALPFVERMNRLHESSDADRLAVIEGCSTEDLYQLLICGHEEVYTSTFRLIFSRLMGQMENEGLDAYNLIEKNDPLYKNYRQLLVTCSSYGRLKDFLGTIYDPARIGLLSRKEAVLKRFITELFLSKNKTQVAVSIVELMVYEKDKNVIKSIERYFLDAYKKASDPEIRKLYSIIGAIYFTNTQASAFQEFAKEYPMRPVMAINRQELLNSNNEIVEQQYFYDDEDGKESFALLTATYKADHSWSIDDKGTYVVFSKAVNGIKISIYANKPENEREGVENIHKVFKEKRLQSIIVVHRGHSYHAASTIENIPFIARIVYLGSCGGFGNVSAVLERAPQAQIISTKGRGSGAINDPLLKNISEAALQPELEWEKVWNKTEKQIGGEFLEDFQYYIPPYKNIAAQLIRAYNNIH